MEYTLFNGQVIYNLTKENKGILDMLCKSNEEADTFTFDYLMDAMHENLAVGEYRIDRIESSNITAIEFESAFSLNVVQACEDLFKHKVTNHMFSLLTNKINCGDLNARKLFERHVAEPTAKLLRLLL